MIFFFCFLLLLSFFLIPSIDKREYREKLGAKAVREEFHGNGITWGQAGAQRKLLYGWGTINANIWLPSLSELVGITGTEHPDAGVYKSAMQGLNVSVNYWTDAQGGSQFAYFKQYNISGGGEKIWSVCNRQTVILRSTYCSHEDQIWYLANQTAFYNTSVRTASHAVHPAVLAEQASYLW